MHRDDYLQKCINSLINQKIKSNIIIYASNIKKDISLKAKKYKIKIYRKKNKVKNITNDWNTAYSLAKTKWVTLVHDDDIYDKDYLKEINKVVKKYPNLLIIFTDYAQIINNKIVKLNALLLIKRVILLTSFLIKKKISSKFFKKNILRFGSPIACPSVTYNKKIIKEKPFNKKYSVNLDWDLWIRLANLNGSIYWIKKILFYHRIHINSVTSKSIQSGQRQIEDKNLLNKIWPKYISLVIFKLFSLTYFLNEKKN
jgi:cellulose synthase/poly-beta-1,6-N-acetylglucosamine synthase-like glycosyltransferase